MTYKQFRMKVIRIGKMIQRARYLKKYALADYLQNRIDHLFDLYPEYDLTS